MTSLSAIGTRASSSAATREPLAILIIDDDAGDRALCKRTVSGAFGDACKTFTCDTGEQGLETIEKHKPECVLLDYCLPGLNGLDVLKRIRARHPYLPVIFITGRGDVPLAVEALKAGADDFLEKPFEQENLLALVRSSIDVYRTRFDEDQARAGVGARVALLSRREAQVLQGVVAGKSNKMIARDLGISPRTVEVFRSNMMKKMQASSVSEIVSMALSCGIAGAPASSS